MRLQESIRKKIKKIFRGSALDLSVVWWGYPPSSTICIFIKYSVFCYPRTKKMIENFVLSKILLRACARLQFPHTIKILYSAYSNIKRLQNRQNRRFKRALGCKGENIPKQGAKYAKTRANRQKQVFFAQCYYIHTHIIHIYFVKLSKVLDFQIVTRKCLIFKQLCARVANVAQSSLNVAKNDIFFAKIVILC